MKRVTLLWHEDKPIGVCVFCAPAAELRLRNEFFGFRRTRQGYSSYLKRLNKKLWVLSRVVLHPTYRGAGVAAAFVRRSCETCRVPWLETLAVMGHVNPFFEKAGFHRVGICAPRGGKPAHPYGSGRPPRREAADGTPGPVYYVFDNRLKCDVSPLD